MCIVHRRGDGPQFRGIRTGLAPLGACLLAAGLPACVGMPTDRAVISDIEIRGNDELASDDIKQEIASRETSCFLGVFEGLFYDYEVFDRHVLNRDLERVERYYRKRGYYHANARAARVYYSDERHVRVQIEVEEGPPVRIARVDVHSPDHLPDDLALRASVLANDLIPPNSLFDEEVYVQGEQQLKELFTDRGYASVNVRRNAQVDLARNQASVGYWIEPGELAQFGALTIEGLGSIPEAPVRRAADIEAGEPFSSSALEEAERAVLNLGVFSSVHIEPQLDATTAGGNHRVPLVMHVEPTRLHSVKVGGGVQLDSIKTDAHLVAGWESHNFFGGLRHYLIEVRPGVVLYPTRLPTLQPPDRLLPEGRVRSEFRQPAFLEARTKGVVRGEASIAPILLSPEQQSDGPILGYREFRSGVGVERSFWKTFGSVSQNLQVNSPFTYVGPLDPDVETIVVSYPELTVALDLRDDRIQPHKGLYLNGEVQVAGVGGDARDVRLQPEANLYIPVGRRLTLALRASVGLLFPFNYGQTTHSNAYYGTPGETTRAQWVRDVQITFLRGFFSGGPGSNRGYAAREVGPHGAVPFYNPGQSSDTITGSCESGSPDVAQGSCDLPLGGFSMWEASLELRFPIVGPFMAALFADASDVSADRLDLRLRRLHLSVGPGLRYDTPIGPVRLDVGYRVPGLQAPDSPDEGNPSTTFGLPIAISFGIGEAS
jgi:outer membrane protein insertion porin family/translocation and assembly module TamA